MRLRATAAPVKVVECAERSLRFWVAAAKGYLNTEAMEFS
jgi:hypothetical protein